MKFLLDVHFGPSFLGLLETKGHKCRLVVHAGHPKMIDSEILDMAYEAGEVVITHDLDFGKLLAFSGKPGPSVIIFRLKHINNELFFDLLTACWNQIEAPLLNGALIIVEPDAVRIRNSPIGK